MYRQKRGALNLGLSPVLFLDLELFLPALMCFLDLRPMCLSLVSQHLLAALVGLQLMDVFHKNQLVFKHILLHLQVQAVIHAVVSLLIFIASPEQPPLTSHAGYFSGIWQCPLHTSAYYTCLYSRARCLFSTECRNGRWMFSEWSVHLWLASRSTDRSWRGWFHLPHWVPTRPFYQWRIL